MAWFDDLKTPRIKSQTLNDRVSKVPEGLWVKCPKCGEILQSKVLKENLYVCPECTYHHRMGALDRIAMLTDGEFKEIGSDLKSNDPLQFDDLKPYRERLKAASSQYGINDAFIAGKASLQNLPYYLGVFEFRFMGGSMGVVVGEKVTLLFEAALKDKLPVVIVSASGGARMQEGILSLMQMAKTSALISQLREARVPYFSVLTDPTTGGVAASFAMLGDIIMAEPQALIGFAGPRVIEQTIRQALPEGFQRSEFLLKHGFIDQIVSRQKLAHELNQWMWRLGQRTCRFPSN